MLIIMARDYDSVSFSVTEKTAIEKLLVIERAAANTCQSMLGRPLS